MSKDYTINELKEFLRARNLAVSGSKAELILRLEEYDNNIWMVLAAEREQQDEEEEDEIREMELLRRERDLARAQAMASPMGIGSVADGSSRSTLSANMSIRAIGDLLCDFDGSDGTFWKWEQQVRLLQTTYELDDKAAKVLISSKLKGRAANWLHSKSEHLVMDVDVILGNRVPIASDELIDYLIDGIADTRLREHTRISRFRTTADLLEAFEKITLETRGTASGDKKFYKRSSDLRGKPEQPKKTVRCFNCGEAGHVSPRCPKPKSREFGACFGCGSTTHQLKDCTRRAANQQEESGTRREPSIRKGSSPTTTANMVQPALPAPYLLSLSYVVTDRNDHSCKYSLNAMLDSGSPISFIKSGFVPVEARTPLPDNLCEFAGINGSRMEILGLFEREVEVEGIPIKLRFYVVPDNTMAFMAVLGRDFSSNSIIRLSFDNGFVVSRRENKSANDVDSAIEQILNIDCISEPVATPEKLRINPELDSVVVGQIKESFQSDYLQLKQSSTDKVDFEMNIVLKHDQPICFRPRRLSYADREKLQGLLDDLLDRKIIRPSESPYSSPIVLVRKKNGETRLCVDYRELNKITIKDNFPSQLIEDNIDQLKNKRYYTTLDLKDGYYNVRMADQAIKFTSFVTPIGQYEFLFCPFGLTNAPKPDDVGYHLN
ncbi:uncharacterized protein LOC143363237 [Halictus rubicundus]|uniref:uncharacterized protein LOC143363237 n=1 Tax=Halictus rubicundus TaxID=77578 RepID=UPI004035C9CA